MGTASSRCDDRESRLSPPLAISQRRHPLLWGREGWREVEEGGCRAVPRLRGKDGSAAQGTYPPSLPFSPLSILSQQQRLFEGQVFFTTLRPSLPSFSRISSTVGVPRARWSSLSSTCLQESREERSSDADSARDRRAGRRWATGGEKEGWKEGKGEGRVSFGLCTSFFSFAHRSFSFSTSLPPSLPLFAGRMGHQRRRWCFGFRRARLSCNGRQPGFGYAGRCGIRLD